MPLRYSLPVLTPTLHFPEKCLLFPSPLRRIHVWSFAPSYLLFTLTKTKSRGADRFPKNRIVVTIFGSPTPPKKCFEEKKCVLGFFCFWALPTTMLQKEKKRERREEKTEKGKVVGEFRFRIFFPPFFFWSETVFALLGSCPVKSREFISQKGRRKVSGTPPRARSQKDFFKLKNPST